MPSCYSQLCKVLWVFLEQGLPYFNDILSHHNSSSHAVIAKEPKNIKLSWERAALYRELKDYKKAVDSFEEILKV